MELDKILSEGLSSWNIDITENQQNNFKIYMDTLLEYNKVMNLTAIQDPEEIYTKHFLDSLSCLLVDELKTEGLKAIDVGTGAGFPSIPIKIMRPDIKMTMLDSLNKRINFLKEVGARVGLDNAEYLHSRAEDAGSNPKYREQYDIVLSRAVASLPVLLEYCSPFLKKGGYFICQKGPAAKSEVEQAKKALAVLGCSLEYIKEIDIPYTDLNHNILVIKKISNTPKNYPRKAGKPSKEPLI